MTDTPKRRDWTRYDERAFRAQEAEMVVRAQLAEAPLYLIVAELEKRCGGRLAIVSAEGRVIEMVSFERKGGGRDDPDRP